MLRTIPYAPTRTEAERLRTVFTRWCGDHSYEAASEALERDWEGHCSKKRRKELEMATTWRNGPNKHFWACVGFSEPPIGHYAPDVDQCQNMARAAYCFVSTGANHTFGCVLCKQSTPDWYGCR